MFRNSFSFSVPERSILTVFLPQTIAEQKYSCGTAKPFQNTIQETVPERQNYCGTRKKQTVPEQFFRQFYVRSGTVFTVKKNRSGMENCAFRNGLF